MSRRAVQSLKNYLRQISDDGSRPSDTQLLRQFIDANDHRAFETLLERHGPMVLGTARRLVSNNADADDVFQAAFLSLARLAKSIRSGQTIPNWLYKTTCRIAARARQRRTVSFENAPEPIARGAAENDLVWGEVQAALDEELQRLPERLRSPLLLCYLSGLSRDEAAEQLGWSLGTLKRRLEQGRAALRKRLEQRGIVAAGLALAVLSPATLSATVSRSLAQSCLDVVLGKSVAARLLPLLVTTSTFKGIAMKAIIVTLALVGLGIGIYSTFGNAQPATPIDPKQPNVPSPTAKRVDALGDPLPDGAMMRLGTRRFRVGSWKARPDGESYLFKHASQIRRINAKTGVVVETWPIGQSRGNLTWAGATDVIVDFSPDARYVLFTNEYIHHGLIESAQEWRLSLYDLTERKEVWSISKNLEPKDWPQVRKCVFSANGKWFVTGCREGQEIRLWDFRTGKQLWDHASKGQPLSPVGFIDDDQTIVLHGDNDGYIYLFDRAKGMEKKSFATVPMKTPTGKTLLSPDGKHVVISGYASKPPSIWDWEGREVGVMEGHKDFAWQMAFSPDGKKLYTGGFDSFVIEREWPSGKTIRKIELERNRMQGLAVSVDGKRLEVSFEGEQALIFYDLKTGKQMPEPISSHRATIWGVEGAPDGSLVSFGGDKSVRTWDLKQRKDVAQIAVDLDQNGRGFALSPDGTLVAVPNFDVTSIDIIERLTGKRLRNIKVDEWFSDQHLKFSADGRFLAALVGQCRSAHVWEVDSGVLMLKVKAGNTCNTVAGAFSPDSRMFAFGDGGHVRMWDTATWKEGTGLQVTAHQGTACLEYSPDGRMIATTGDYGDGVRLYEVATRRVRLHVKPPEPRTGQFRFSHNGRLLAWVYNRGKIDVLDLRTGASAGPFTGHDSPIWGLTFTIDDNALATSSSDCTILVWDLSTKTGVARAPDGNPDANWQALRGEDASKAFTAIRALAAHPEIALKFANEHLKPVEPVDPQWLAARLRDLDNPKFAERERATRELEESGDRCIAAVERFLTAKPSTEGKARADKILTKTRGRDVTDEAVQALRTLEVLEWIGSAKARELVERVATGAEGATLTVAAKGSLKRWK